MLMLQLKLGQESQKVIVAIRNLNTINGWMVLKQAIKDSIGVIIFGLLLLSIISTLISREVQISQIIMLLFLIWDKMLQYVIMVASNVPMFR